MASYVTVKRNDLLLLKFLEGMVVACPENWLFYDSFQKIKIAGSNNFKEVFYKSIKESLITVPSKDHKIGL